MSRRLSWGYPVLICVYRLPCPCFWMLVIKRQSYYWRCKTKNCWCSIDTHSHNRAGRVSLSVFPIKEANVTGVLNPNNQYKIYWVKYSRLSKKLFLSSSYPKTQPIDLLRELTLTSRSKVPPGLQRLSSNIWCSSFVRRVLLTGKSTLFGKLFEG